MHNADEVHPDVKPISASTMGQTTGFCYQFKLLAARNFMNLVRLPQTSYVKVITTTLTALFAILLFWNTPKD
jgi:hypothetical protein